MIKLDVKGKLKIWIMVLCLPLLVITACNGGSNKEKKSSEVSTDTLRTTDGPMLTPDSTSTQTDTGGSKGGQNPPPIK